jgi:ADP-ribosylglycohydrolase
VVTRSDRIAGCVYGAAIGDALGSAFEFVGSDEIERHLGSAFAWDYRPAIKGSLLCPRAPGNPTDDTAMALSVATAIASGEPLTAELFASRFLADLKRGSGRFAEMFWNGGPGNATTDALSRPAGGDRGLGAFGLAARDAGCAGAQIQDAARVLDSVIGCERPATRRGCDLDGVNDLVDAPLVEPRPTAPRATVPRR